MGKLTSSAFLHAPRDSSHAMEDRLKRVRTALASCTGLDRNQLPPDNMINRIGYSGVPQFLAAQSIHFEEMVQRGRIEPDETVLDLGCGCGRLATPFAQYLDGGTYIGIDVWREALDWCRGTVKARSGTMRFIERETVNKYSFEIRKPISRNSYHLSELQHEQIGFAFAISLFTQLQQRDSLSYLSELARVLKRNACAYLTAHVIDDFFFDYVRRTGRHRAATQEEPGCYYAYEGQEFFAGYTYRTWTRMIEDSGLRIVGYEPGHWAGKPGALHHQDTFLVIPLGYRKE
ncbi:class I SAM-dependent methyltransferase [Nisaea acidiphila]|uniref:Class I SAM-dependent methyltransferase n=1 Tax=Nisaea acidiphila TaxID=1862145 RepID=A0A9J7AWX4_9PROT|nr:class I SAM-dependent methyltransferase [Nisaea acidiphila]UUX51298.1 class I SAM-dependent methyltransferase [Nisaea acidiphila]